MLRTTDWAQGFTLGCRDNERSLRAWAMFHNLAEHDAHVPSRIPPIPPMVLQMLNTASLDTRIVMKMDNVTRQIVLASSKELALPASLLAFNWWRGMELKSIPDPAWWTGVSLRLRRLQLQGSDTIPPDLLHTPAFRSLRHVQLDASIEGNVAAVARLPLISSLRVRCCTVDDLDEISRIPTLTKLHLTKCSDLASVSSLAQCPSLTHVTLVGCDALLEPTGLERLSTLTTLRLEDCAYLGSVSCLATSSSLTELSVRDCKHVRDVAGLEFITTLRVLTCSKLASVSSLMSATLVELTLQTCKLRDVAGLERIPTLAKLRLDGCFHLASLVSLATCPALTDLIVQGCDALIDVKGLERIATLQRLRIEGCSRLMSLSRLASSTSLTVLVVRECPALRDLAGIERIPTLTTFLLKGQPRV